MTGRTATYDTDAPGNIGFFLFPPAEEGGVHGSMGVPVTFGIAANAKNADCAAFFLNWVGDRPGGAPDQRDRRRLQPGRARRPAAARRSPEGSVTNDTLAGRRRSPRPRTA